MAQFLYERHSVNVHLNIGKRHLRICRQVKGAEELGTAIEPFHTELLAKRALRLAARETTEYNRDSLTLADANLDDRIRDLGEDCKKYDRNHPESMVTPLLFPNGVSQYIYAPIELEPTQVEKLIMGIQNLGEAHELAIHIPILQEAIAANKTIIDNLHAAITAEQNAVALMAIAKLNLTRQYEQNIYAANLKFGKNYSARLFPAIRKPSKKSEQDDNSENIAE